MASFDVVSLFTKVPTADAVDVINNLLHSDQTYHIKTGLSISSFIDLLRFCLGSTYFVYRDNYYEMRSGSPMGSPLSPAVCILYLDYLEKKIINKSPYPIVMWKRYVDDIFLVFTNNSTQTKSVANVTEDLLKHSNQFSNTIQFTCDFMNTQKELARLDVYVKIEADGRFSTTVYRKPTNTNLYLSSTSAHSWSSKLGTIRCLTNRALRICSPQFLKKELDFLQGVFMDNGYSERTTNKIMSRCVIQHYSSAKIAEKDSISNYVVLPTSSFTCRLKPTLRKLNIRVWEKPAGNLRSYLTRVKDPTSPDDRSNGVYRIPCGCGKYYIGQTKRSINTRMKEHKSNIRRNVMSSVTSHALTCDQSFQFGNAQFVDRESRLPIRLLKESFAIHYYKARGELVQQDESAHFDKSWNKILESCLKYK